MTPCSNVQRFGAARVHNSQRVRVLVLQLWYNFSSIIRPSATVFVV